MESPHTSHQGVSRNGPLKRLAWSQRTLGRVGEKMRYLARNQARMRLGTRQNFLTNRATSFPGFSPNRPYEARERGLREHPVFYNLSRKDRVLSQARERGTLVGSSHVSPEQFSGWFSPTVHAMIVRVR